MLRSLVASAFLVPAVAATENLFASHPFYLNPVNQRSYDASIASATDAVVKENLQTMRGIASAYWIDKKNKIRGNSTRTVQGILADAAAKSPPELVVLIWYDFPNRDCAAAASAGEICCAYNSDGTCNWGKGGDCTEGINEYKTGYVDPFIEVLEEFKGKLPIVIVFEPDSLPNFATNLGKPHCGARETRNSYMKGAEYALNQLTSRTDASVYVDAAHGGWLGWANNMVKFMTTLKELNVPWTKIRGFSTNVAGYQPLGTMCPWMPDSGGEAYRNGYCLNQRHKTDPCCADACNLLSQYDPANSEMNFAQELYYAAKGELGMEARIIIDSGRNGVPDERQACRHWCNIRGAGAGHRSTIETGSDMIDAFFYLKTPGESDGCTQVLPDGKRCPRFDVMCGSSDSIGSTSGEPRAPEAGGWFDYQVKQLAQNANFDSVIPPAPPTPPAPTPPSPGPAPPSPGPSPPAPLPPGPSPTGGSCCWGGCNSNNCDTSGWCAQSQSHCTGSCNGMYCPAALSQVAAKKVPVRRSWRGKFLHRADDHSMLQKTKRRSQVRKADEL